MITGVQPGVQAIFQAVPLDQFGNTATLPPGVTPQWSSSDTNAPTSPVSGDQTGLMVSVTTDATSGPTSGSFTLSITASLPDGSNPSGTATVPFIPGGAAGAAVVSFSIDQVAPARNPSARR